MKADTDIRDTVEQAASVVGRSWPLHSFVTANPLAGLEDEAFPQAVQRARRLFGGRGYPRAEVFRQAWEDGRINHDILEDELAQRGFEADPEALLDRLAAAQPDTPTQPDPATAEVDRLISKWLAAFLDEGTANWPMPDREQGFYAAFRSLARHDEAIPGNEQIAELPEDPLAVIEHQLAPLPEPDREPVLEHHLTALHGWTSLIRRREQEPDAWSQACPISLVDYLAVRLTLVDLLEAPLDPRPEPDVRPDPAPLAEAWLSAWEATYRRRLVEQVTEASASLETEDQRPAAQLVFCIDTRSEVIRRHVEQTGPYETHGYAGFFGVPIRYEGYGSEVSVDACPPIVDAEHRVTEQPVDEQARSRHDTVSGLLEAARSMLAGVKTNVATAFNFVESTGAGYGAAMAARTLLPASLREGLGLADELVPDEHAFCQPTLDGDEHGIAFEDQVECAASAFELMGWERFGRLVVFVGHASETANNPFDASLDCGACAGNPGGPNARVLASICNRPEVREALRERGIEIPEDTVFLAGEHNTTTDEITLFDGEVPASHREELASLREDLDRARERAAAERVASAGEDAERGVRETQRRAADWAETRPEWGLAGNAAFVIGPRELTADVDLDGRAFLHSYDWSTDPQGDAIEQILTGPWIVTQWINAQYYFATVDTETWGSGSKVTQNPVGNVGVYQGNGGDLGTGLPMQSVMRAEGDPYHQPLRLSTVVHAPVDRIATVVEEHDELARLLDNGWLSLTVVDPTREHAAFTYEPEAEWTPLAGEADALTEEPEVQPAEIQR